MTNIEITFDHTDGQTYTAEVVGIFDDGSTVALDITDPAWTGRRNSWETDTADLNSKCGCGRNPFKLCHPGA